jgi:hypothetical protein
MPYLGAVGAAGAGFGLTFFGLLARSSSSCSFTLRANAGSLAIAALKRFSFSSASIGYFLVHAFVNVNTAIYVDGMRCRSKVMLSRMSERRREMPKSLYYLRFINRPLCDHMGCQAGIIMCRDADVTSCSYTTLKDARAAMRRINKLPGWAGAASVVQGECPRVAENA